MTPPAWQGAIVLFLAGLAYDVMLATMRRLEGGSRDAGKSGGARREARWLGYGRDASNLLGFLLFLVGFRLLGLGWPLALLATSIWTLGFYGFDYFLARSFRLARPQLAFAAVLAVLVVGVAALREPVAGLLSGVVVRLFA
jgi:hypothetical protein